MHAWFQERDGLLRIRREAHAAVEAAWDAMAKAGPVEACVLIESLRDAQRRLADVECRCEAHFKDVPTFTAARSGGQG